MRTSARLTGGNTASPGYLLCDGAPITDQLSFQQYPVDIAFTVPDPAAIRQHKIAVLMGWCDACAVVATADVEVVSPPPSEPATVEPLVVTAGSTARLNAANLPSKCADDPFIVRLGDRLASVEQHTILVAGWAAVRSHYYRCCQACCSDCTGSVVRSGSP